jgi:hypothetical protein
LPPPTGGGNFVKFEKFGDGVEGVIVDARIHQFSPDDDELPQYDIKTNTGAIRTWTVSQADAYRQVCELQPQIGNRISAIYESDYRTANGKTGKRIVVTIIDDEPRRLL